MRLRLNRKVLCTTAVVAAVTLLVISPVIAVYYIYQKFTSNVNALVQGFNKYGFDGLSDVSLVRKLTEAGKTGGFINLQQQTVERLFFVSHPVPVYDENGNAARVPGNIISFVGLDMSHSGEASYIYKRILSRRSFKAKRLVVDIGANDGLLSSNSFNFIQWGWDAVLVEPQKDQLQLAKKNTERYRDPFLNRHQEVKFVNAVISDTSGFIDLIVPNDLVSMQAHIKTNNTAQLKGRSITVRSMTVQELAHETDIPKFFGILSVDAEGVGDKILKSFISQGFRPFYIIYESLHNNESLAHTWRYLADNGYKYMTRRGWNHLFEFNPSEK